MFGTEGDDPGRGTTGADRHRMVGLNTELGMKFNVGRFTSGLVYHALFNLSHESSRSGVADNRSANAADPVADSPIQTLDLFHRNSQGIELRFGLRF